MIPISCLAAVAPHRTESKEKERGERNTWVGRMSREHSKISHELQCTAHPPSRTQSRTHSPPTNQGTVVSLGDIDETLEVLIASFPSSKLIGNPYLFVLPELLIELFVH